MADSGPETLETRGKPYRLLTVLAIWIIAFAIAGRDAARAEENEASASPEPPAPQELNAEVVEARRKSAEESKDLDDETKKRIADHYRQSADELKRAGDALTKAASYKNNADTVQARLDAIRAQLDELKSKGEPSLPAVDFYTDTQQELANLKQELAKQELLLSEQKAKQTSAEAKPTKRANRRRDIRTLLFSAPDRLADLKRQLEAPPPANEPPLLTLARRTEQQAKLRAIEQEIPALQNELAMFDAEESVDLVRLDRDLKTQLAAFTEKTVRLYEARAKELEAEAARIAVKKARDEAVDAQPLLKELAIANHEFAEEAQRLSKPIKDVDFALNGPDGVKRRLEDLQKQFDQTKKKVDAVGQTSAIGSLLRRQRAILPDVGKHRQNVHGRSDRIDDVEFQLLRYDDLRSELSNPERIVHEILSRANTGLTEANVENLRSNARHALDRRSEYLNSLIRNYNTYFDTLVELDNTEQQLIKLTETYANYINERVLWIRSGKLLSPHAVVEERESYTWLLSGRCWAEAADQLWIDLKKNAVPWGFALLLFGHLFYFRLRFRKEVREIGCQTRRKTFKQIAPTLRVAFLTVVLAALWPGLVCYVGWRLNSAAEGSEHVKAVAHALLVVAAVYLPLEIFRQACRRDGLAQAHFDWSQSAMHALRNNLRWLILAGLPLLFVTVVLAERDREQGRDALERVFFLLVMVLLTWFLRRVLNPARGVFSKYLAYHRGGWADRLKYLWYWLLVLAPVVLALLDVIGYYYTARQLAWRLHSTIWLLVVLMLIREFLLRWVLVHRRRLSIEQARQRVASAAAASQLPPSSQKTASEQDPRADTPSPGLSSIVPVEDRATDLSTISEQTTRVLSIILLTGALIGLWLIWVDVLPALKILDRWPLWTTTQTITEVVPAPDGETLTRTDETPVSITVADLVLACLIAAITVICARNIPGLLEISLLQRLPLEASVRYAVTSIASYVIVLLGIILACGRIGVSWSQIQWLATALTFGLAFGLQEIFANFVSGLIILFERPIRVGDVVTIDDVSGVVSRVRIRATTITNWDRKEYVIPNKEFITGRMLNWTLSDSVNRIVIPIGVAYGSDTERVKELLVRICNDHPLILDDPPTMVTFEGFGDSSLNFVVRTFLPNLDNRLNVVHELHTAIDRTFRKAGIEIAFPQRDLHIRSLPQPFVPSGVGSAGNGETVHARGNGNA